MGNRTRLETERGVVSYTYDKANRLIQEIRKHRDDTTATTIYRWDPNGNLIRKMEDGATVATYTWDALNRLTAVEGPNGISTYGYDPTGIRTRVTDSTGPQRFLYSEEDLIAVYRGQTKEMYFAHGPGIDEPWGQAGFGKTKHLAYIHRDGLGSATATSGLNGNLRNFVRYSAFGDREADAKLEIPFGYTSRECDPSGLLYYRTRYYQPELGRFASKDPLRGSILLPGTLNRYPYVLNNPVNLVDPFGLAFAPALPLTGLLGGAVGLALAEAIVTVVAAALLVVGVVVVIYLIVIGVLLIVALIENPWVIQSRRRGADPPLIDATDRPWPPEPVQPEPNDCRGFLDEWAARPWVDPFKYVFGILFILCEANKP